MVDNDVSVKEEFVGLYSVDDVTSIDLNKVIKDVM